MRKLLALSFLLVSSVAAADIAPPVTDDKAEERRCLNAQAVVEHAGYKEVAVRWHHAGTEDPVYVAEGARDGKRHLLVAVVTKHGRGEIVDLGEAGEGGLDQLDVVRLFDAPAIVDVVSSHMPFRLESSTSRTTHDLVRLDGKPAAVCHVDGTVWSAYSKGISTHESRREVTLAAVAGAKPPTFTVTTVESTTERPGDLVKDKQPKTTVGATSTKRWDLPPGGTCREVAAK